MAGRTCLCFGRSRAAAHLQQRHGGGAMNFTSDFSVFCWGRTDGGEECFSGQTSVKADVVVGFVTCVVLTCDDGKKK